MYEVTKGIGDAYRVQTNGENGHVGAFVTIYARNEKEHQYIASLRTDQRLSFKGRVDGVLLRHIVIDPAILN